MFRKKKKNFWTGIKLSIYPPLPPFFFPFFPLFQHFFVQKKFVSFFCWHCRFTGLRFAGAAVLAVAIVLTVGSEPAPVADGLALNAWNGSKHDQSKIWLVEFDQSCHHWLMLGNYLSSINLGCSTAVERTPHDREVMGSNPAWCWDVLFSSLSYQLCDLNQDLHGGTTILIFLQNRLSHAAWGDEASTIRTDLAKQSNLAQSRVSHQWQKSICCKLGPLLQAVLQEIEVRVGSTYLGDDS